MISLVNRRTIEFVILFFCLISSIHTLKTADNQKKVNKLNLLLPQIFENLDKRAPRYLLEASNGCYSWSSSEPDFLSVTGYKDEQNPRCETQALVKLNKVGSHDNIIWISASDKDTGDTIGVESKIALVQRIKILTRLRTIDVGDLIELEVIGEDAEGNTFSSLEGLRFEWSIRTGTDIFQYITFKESKIHTSQIRKYLENQNYQTDIIVIKALQTGSALIEVKMKELNYKDVSASVTLYAIDKFNIYPGEELFLLPLSILQYKLYFSKRASHDEFIKNVADYKWAVNNENIGQIKLNNGKLYTKQVNNIKTKVVVRPNKENVQYEVSSEFSVVFPTSLQILYREYTSDSWEIFKKDSDPFERTTYFVRDREYYFRIVLYDDNKNQIKITENVEINVQFDKNVFEKISDAHNSNYEYRMKPVQLKSNTYFNATLISVKGEGYSAGQIWRPQNIVISHELTLSVVMRLKLFKPGQFLHLPNYSEQIFNLKVIGGSGQYDWDTTNTTVAKTSQNRIHPKSVGRATLHVSDKMNEKNTDKIEVIVSEVMRSAPLEQMMEVLVGQSERTFAIAYPETSNLRFSNCSALNFYAKENPFYSTSSEKLSYEEILDGLNQFKENNYINSILQVNALGSFNEEFQEYIKLNIISQQEVTQTHRLYNNYGYCSSFQINGKQGGEYRAHLKIQNFELQDSIESYISVKVLIPFKNIINENYYNFFQNDEVVISMGSTYNWVFKYGPSQWESHRKIKLESSVKKECKNCAEDNCLTSKIPQVTNQGNITQSYVLSCGQCNRNYQENQYLINIRAQNTADVKLPRPKELHNNLIVWCNVPHSLYIYPLNETNYQKNNYRLMEQSILQEPKTSRYNKYHLQTEMKHFLFTQVFDTRNKPFANFTSLAINWKMTPESECGPLSELYDSEYKEKLRLNIPSSLTSLKKDEFRKFVLNQCLEYASHNKVIKIQATSTRLENSDSPVSFSVHDEIIIAVDRNVECNPEDSLLYNHKDNKYYMELLHGSGSFNINNNDTSVVKEYLQDQNQHVTFTTYQPGIARLDVFDLLQYGAKKIECRVLVRDPVRIELRITQDIIPVGEYTQATVIVYDDNNRKYSLNQISLMIIDLESDTSDTDNPLAINRDRDHKDRFIIQGKKKGIYRLVAVLKSKPTLRSNSLDLEVFPPLEAYPSRIILHPNCLTSLQLIGGPSDSTRIHYSNPNQHNEKLFDLTKLDTKLYEIKASSRDIGESTLEFNIHLLPNNTLLSQVTVHVTVQNIDELKIFGMRDRTLHLTTTVRLIAQMFINNQQMTTSICPLQISWQSKLDGVLRISQNISPEIISLSDSNDSSNKNKVNVGDSHLYAVNATALEVGIAEVELTVTFLGQNNKQVKTVASIEVINPITIPVPTYVAYPDIRPSILLIPPKSGYFMPLQNPLKYKFSTSCDSFALKQSDSIKVDGNGHITTGDKKGVSTQVRVQSTFLDQDIMSVHVYTTSIFSLFVENSYEVINMQVEGETTLQVRMQDFLGRSFPTRLDGVQLKVKVTNTKVLSATISDSSLLNLRAISAGVSICTVYLEENHHIYDIFFVNVGSIVTPSSPVFVHTGGIIQFSILQGKSIGERYNNKRWSSSNENVLTIDNNRGLAKAHQQGEVIVQFSDVVVYKSKVIVQEVGEIVRIDIGKNNRITNDLKHPAYAPKYVIPFQVYLKDKNGGKEPLKRLENTLEKNNINNNLVWTCRAEQSEWFNVVSEVIDLPNGLQQPQCIVKLVEPNSYKTKSMPPSLILITTITSRSSDTQFKFIQEHKFTDIIWKIFLSNNEKYVELNRAVPKQDIYIQTITPLDIYYGGSDIKQHVISKFHEQQSVQKIEIYVSPEYNEPIDSTISVKHPQSSQQETIRVVYDPKGYEPPSNDTDGRFTWTDYLITVILICVTIVVLQSLSKNK